VRTGVVGAAFVIEATGNLLGLGLGGEQPPAPIPAIAAWDAVPGLVAVHRVTAQASGAKHAATITATNTTLGTSITPSLVVEGSRPARHGPPAAIRCTG